MSAWPEEWHPRWSWRGALWARMMTEALVCARQRPLQFTARPYTIRRRRSAGCCSVRAACMVPRKSQAIAPQGTTTTALVRQTREVSGWRWVDVRRH